MSNPDSGKKTTKLPSPSIFISYAHEDRAHAMELFVALKAIEEIKPWMDNSALRAGSKWEQEIFTAINHCRVFIVLISEKWVAKDGFARTELDYAIDRQQFSNNNPTIVPVYLEDVASSHDYLDSIHAINIYADRDAGLLQLRRSVRDSTRKDVHKALSSQLVYREASREPWDDEYGDFIFGLHPSTVKDVAGEFDRSVEVAVYGNLVKIGRKRNSTSVAEYVGYLFDLVLSGDHPLFTVESYHVFLDCVKELPTRIQSLFMEKMFNYLCDEVQRLSQGDFMTNYLLATVTRRLIVLPPMPIRSGANFTSERLPAAIAQRFFATTEFDCLFFDVALTYAARINNAAIIYQNLHVFDLLARTHARDSNSDAPVAPPFGELLERVEECRTVTEWMNGTTTTKWNRSLVGRGGGHLLVPELNPGKVVRLDMETFERDRCGLALRIGMFLCRRNPGFGLAIMDRALTALTASDPEAAAILTSLPDPDWAGLSQAIESMNVEQLHSILGGPEEFGKIARYLNVGINYVGVREETLGALGIDLD